MIQEYKLFLRPAPQVINIFLQLNNVQESSVGDRGSDKVK